MTTTYRLFTAMLVILSGSHWATAQAKVVALPPLPKKRLVTFSGLRWEVKVSQGRLVGPGPNLFSDSADNVWVDTNGRLHLRITKRAGRYVCAEVICQKSFGYGTYTFQVEAVKNLAPAVVGGLFTWDNTSPAFSHREIDFEYSYWLNPKSPNFQMVVQPYQQPGRINRYSVPVGQSLVHRFTWQPSSIDFVSFEPTVSLTKPLASWQFAGSAIPKPGREQVRFNLWLFRGLAPTGTGDPEIIISHFQFKK